MAGDTVLVPLMGRQVEMRKPSEGSIVVLARIARTAAGIPESDFDPAQLSEEQRAKIARDLGVLGRILDQMIVSDADKDWIDDLLIGGEASPEDVFGLVTGAAKAFADAVAPAAGPVKAARRVRTR